MPAGAMVPGRGSQHTLLWGFRRAVWKQPDSNSWTGHSNTALMPSEAEHLACAPLRMRAALPMPCAVNRGKIQHFYFKITN